MISLRSRDGDCKDTARSQAKIRVVITIHIRVVITIHIRVVITIHIRVVITINIRVVITIHIRVVITINIRFIQHSKWLPHNEINYLHVNTKCGPENDDKKTTTAWEVLSPLVSKVNFNNCLGSVITSYLLGPLQQLPGKCYHLISPRSTATTAWEVLSPHISKVHFNNCLSMFHSCGIPYHRNIERFSAKKCLCVD